MSASPRSSGAQLLEVDSVSFHTGGAALLDTIGFSLQPGELTLLLGPNGAGKSTLLRLLAREQAPSAGEIRLLGRPLSEWRAAELAGRRAVMPQDCPLTFPFTASEVVALGLPPPLPSRVGRTVVQELLEWLEVVHLAQRSYPSLSGGEQQRVQLARVLAQIWRSPGPRLRLLDEATSALDPAHQYRIMAMLRTLARQAEIGVIAACHDLPLAASFASRVLLLRDGRLLADGAPGQVLSRENLAGVYDLDAEVHSGDRPRIHIAGCLRPVPDLPGSLRTDC
ncbi:MAG: heme ABC transporter ATP-binding protein [Ectothiorhodospiraceae bacterium]|nr:heme ABC transporter ATP-binding protein [Ectothiorhodospiraceae bacterium]